MAPTISVDTSPLTAKLVDTMSLEELIEIAESQAWCEVYGILKRPNEKYVTRAGPTTIRSSSRIRSGTWRSC